MWKQPPKVSSDSSADNAPIHAPSTESVEGPEAGRPRRVGVRIIRPDGSVRDVTVAGHFREEHLCSLVDDELCRIKGSESLVLHLFEPDGELIHSLRSRWQEGLSDNRRVFGAKCSVRLRILGSFPGSWNRSVNALRRANGLIWRSVLRESPPPPGTISASCS